MRGRDGQEGLRDRQGLGKGREKQKFRGRGREKERQRKIKKEKGKGNERKREKRERKRQMKKRISGRLPGAPVARKPPAYCLISNCCSAAKLYPTLLRPHGL